MIHPEAAYAEFQKAFDFDIGSVGHNAYETCDAYLKIFIACHDDFAPEHTARAFFSSMEDLCELQKKAERYGLLLSYHAHKGIFDIANRFSYWGTWRDGQGETSVEDALLYADTIEEIRNKVNSLLPAGWEDTTRRLGEKLSDFRLSESKRITILQFINNQIEYGISEEILISRTSGMMDTRREIVEQLYEHVLDLREKGIAV